MSKTVLAGLSALAVSATLVISSPAAAAFQFHGGGFGGFHGGGGFGGFHGGMGGFHPGFGGFRPGFAGVHPGFGGFHPGFGGFHPGFAGVHPGFGGFHPGFVHGPGFFHHGFVGRRVFFNRNVFVGGPGGCWGGWCGGGWWWPGFATGAIVGAAAAYPYDDNGCWVYRPAYRHGIYVGRYLVNICY
jgi:hypothetical protein